MILAGDIGGTNTRLALFEHDGSHLSVRSHTDYVNRNYATFEDLIADFLRTIEGRVSTASLAVAGPVVNNVVSGTNLPWRVDANSILNRAGLAKVVLLNDLMALANGIQELCAEDIEVLQAGVEDPSGNRAVVAAGTGLGEAALVRVGKGYMALPSEGGHTDFAPCEETETKLLLHLLKRYNHVSYERVLSGMGTVNIYEFLRDTGLEGEPAALREELASATDKAAVISQHGLSNHYAICVRTLEMLGAIFAAEAGNVALRVFATGGVYLGGGIAPKIAPVLRTESFRQRFCSKGRLQSLLEKIPVKLVLNQHTGLIGAAAYGFETLHS
ncbi:MAG: glucokinase [Acidobacteriales bacterium]|nr:glucokinase [Terriglobales bacterium]